MKHRGRYKVTVYCDTMQQMMALNEAIDKVLNLVPDPEPHWPSEQPRMNIPVERCYIVEGRDS